MFSFKETEFNLKLCSVIPPGAPEFLVYQSPVYIFSFWLVHIVSRMECDRKEMCLERICCIEWL